MNEICEAIADLPVTLNLSEKFQNKQVLW